MKKIYILDAFHEAGIALAKAHAEVVCWPDPAIADWPEHADGVMVRMRPITAEEIERMVRDYEANYQSLISEISHDNIISRLLVHEKNPMISKLTSILPKRAFIDTADVEIQCDLE